MNSEPNCNSSKVENNEENLENSKVSESEEVQWYGDIVSLNNYVRHNAMTTDLVRPNPRSFEDPIPRASESPGQYERSTKDPPSSPVPHDAAVSGVLQWPPLVVRGQCPVCGWNVTTRHERVKDGYGGYFHKSCVNPKLYTPFNRMSGQSTCPVCGLDVMTIHERIIDEFGRHFHCSCVYFEYLPFRYSYFEPESKIV